MNFNDEYWDALAGKLRKEIEAYGHLFELLEEQRDQCLSKDLAGLTEVNESMNDHTSFLHGLKSEREALVKDLWNRCSGDSEQATVKDLIKYSPQQSWPLFDELIQEVNRLIQRSQQQLERNQMLLRCSWEIGQKFIGMLVPEEANGATLYAYNGHSNRTAEKLPISRYKKQA